MPTRHVPAHPALDDELDVSCESLSNPRDLPTTTYGNPSSPFHRYSSSYDDDNHGFQLPCMPGADADADADDVAAATWDDQHGSYLTNTSPDDVSFSQSTLALGVTEIVDGILYLGSLKDVSSQALCEQLGIGAYLCVAKEITPPAHALASGAPVLHLPMRDAADEVLAAHVPAAVAFIDAQAAAGRRVALFCQAGRSRSVSLAVAYVMHHQRRAEQLSSAQQSSAELSSDVTDGALVRALHHVGQRYHRAEPNMSFMRQLAALQ